MSKINDIAKTAGLALDNLKDEEEIYICYGEIRAFYNAVVEECAHVAEQQGRTYTGENLQSDGARSAAFAVRMLKDMS